MIRLKYVLISVVCALSFSAPTLAETAFQKGVRLYNARQYTAALSALQIAEQQDAQNAETHYYLGNAYLQTGDSMRAAREYEQGYSLANGGPVAAYCSSALSGLKQRNQQSHFLGGGTLSTFVTGPRARTRFNTTGFTGYRSSVSCPVGTESHPADGVQKSKTGLTPDEWLIWRGYFHNVMRIAQQQIVPKAVQNWQNMTGVCELYYYVDRNHKLRARIFRSNADDSVNAALLQVVRTLDGTRSLEFPPGVHTDSFNFYHGVNLGDIALMLKRDTSTSLNLMNNNAALHQSDQSATQGKLQLPNFTTAVNASLRSPQITSDVAGKVISAPELKATQGKLPPDTAMRDVQGQIVTDTAGRDVQGQIVTDSARRDVQGQIVTDSARRDVQGQVVSDQATREKPVTEK